jgi:hypothetical protein
VHPDDQHVLVVAAVEDADHPLGRKGLPDPPQEILLRLLVGRLLERRDPESLRVDQPHRVSQGPALARGVHALEHQEGRPAVPDVGDTLREQPLLQVREVVAQREQGLLALLLATHEARGAPAVDGVEVDRPRGQA